MTTMLAPREEALAKLQTTVRGPVIRPGDPRYDEARTLYNAMIDKRPAAILRAASVADVIAGVNFAREQGALLAVRGGGHNGPGLGSCDDGLVIDLSDMNGVHVDLKNRTARVEGGALLGDLHHATQPFNLVTPSGIISTTGVGGITLGGGLGHLTRKYGLAIDNLLEADVVLADGSFTTTAPDLNPELFWAIRGGGGNFGVVTSFLFKLHKLDSLIGGPMLWTVDRAEELLTWYRDFLPRQSDDLNGFFAFLNIPPGDPFPVALHGKTMAGVVWTWTGPAEKFEATFAPIRAMFGGAALDWVGPITHEGLNSLFDPILPAGLQWYWKADFFNELSDEAIAAHVKFGSNLPTLLSTMHLYPIDGAASRVANDATAWSFRDAKWAEVIAGIGNDPAENPRMIAWAKAYWEALHPHSAGGAYVNMMMEEGADRVKASYGANYARLAAAKQHYDPDNLFRVNQNIKPA